MEKGNKIEEEPNSEPNQEPVDLDQEVKDWEDGSEEWSEEGDEKEEQDLPILNEDQLSEANEWYFQIKKSCFQLKKQLLQNEPDNEFFKHINFEQLYKLAVTTSKQHQQMLAEQQPPQPC